MAVKIRLARFGAKKKAFYRIVVSDVRSPRDGRFIERVGTYDPKQNPPLINVDEEKVTKWLHRGAQPTSTVTHLLQRAGINTTVKKTA
jgi:small subunit ribosomal protein S16